MRKTAKQIEKDIFHIVNDNLGSVIKGKCYRKGMRPKNARTEDIVVAFSAGYEAQMQSGEVYVHIYVPYRKGIVDTPRIDILQEAMLALRDGALADNAEYNFTVNTSPNDMDVDEIEQSLISVIITYIRTTF